MKKFILVIFLTVIGKALACDCPPLSIKKAYEKAGNVFIAKITKTDSVYSKFGTTLYIYKARAIKSYKLGHDDFKDTVFAFYANPTSDCDYTFKTGETYLIYTDKSGIEILHASKCLRTSLLSNVIKNDLLELEQLHLLHQAENLGSLPLQSVSIGYKNTLTKNGKVISPDQAVDDLLIEVLTLRIMILIMFVLLVTLLILYIKAKKATKIG